MTPERLTAAVADRYRIERELGQGGMATVYLAEDVRHRRRVALKVLHPELSAVLGTERFLKEIELTANLQHPHILPLFDSGTADGQLFYVMPFVEGESLRGRLERERQLPIADAILIAREVADALHYAHERGVVHRDIKPENILLQGGHALVADFGIALAVQHAGGQRMTQTGLSLGTPHYMSPEQAMGDRTLDARSDIYALGAVTYEMLTGDPPFTGSSAQAIVAKVLTEKPSPPSIMRDTVPAGVEVAVLRALAKLPADRFASASEYKAALADLTTGSVPRSGAARTASARSRWRDPVVQGLAAATAVLGLTLAIVLNRAPPEPFPARTEITGVMETAKGSGASQTFDVAPTGSATLSPDGHAIAFVGPATSGPGTMLYLRRLDQLQARAIPGATNPQSATFSPDGKWIALTSNRRRIIKVPVDGGAAVTLAEVGDDGGMDWSPNDEIIFGFGVMEGLKGLQRVNAQSGGAVQAFTQVDSTRKELSHQFPRILSDGKTVLFTIWYGALETSEIAAVSLDGGSVTPLGVLASKAIGVVDGHIVYVRPDGSIMAAPFDVRARRVKGNPVLVQDSVRVLEASAGDAPAFLTHSGALVYARGGLQRRLVWMNRSGTVTPLLDDVREYGFVRISPDGRQVAVTITSGAKSDIWLLDLATSTLSPLTNSGSVRNPVWSEDGRHILFVSTQGGRSAFWSQPVDGSGPAVKLADAPHNPWWIDLAPGGRTVVFNAIYDGTFNLETFALDSTRERRDIVALPGVTEVMGRFSRDGRAVAYLSDESGRYEVYVRSYPDGGGRIQISNGGGARPVWSRDGRTLFYWEQNRLIAASLARDPSLRVSSRQTLFSGDFDRDFDVSPDGSRFLLIEGQGSNISLVVIPNWLTELRRATRE